MYYANSVAGRGENEDFDSIRHLAQIIRKFLAQIAPRMIDIARVLFYNKGRSRKGGGCMRRF